MSTETVPANSNTADPNVGSAPGMGGTNPEANGSADEGAQNAGEQTQEAVNPAGEEPAAEPEAREDRAPEENPEIAELRKNNAEYEAFLAMVRADPKRMKAVQSWLRGGESEEDSLRAIADRAITEQFEESNHKALRGLVGPLLDKIETLEKQVGGLRPAVDKTMALAADAEFTRGLEKHGIDANTRRDPAFLRILNAERKDPNFQRDERTRPEYAARILANAYKATAGTVSRNAASRRHVESVKNGNLNGSVPAANGASSGKVVVIQKGDHVAALNARIQNPNVKIEYR